MIIYLHQNELEMSKYDRCISESFNSRIYGRSWYLSSVCDDWGALVKDDYVAVMPLPQRKKFGIRYIYLPPWTQQLGVFTKDSVSTSLLMHFLDSIPKRFKMFDLLLNSENKLEIDGVKVRKNYILPLQNSYETLKKNFSKGRKSNISQANKRKMSLLFDYEFKAIIELFKANKAKVLGSQLDYESLNMLLASAKTQKQYLSVAVLNEMNVLIAGAIFLLNTHRITYLFSAMNKEGREKQAISFLLDSIMKRYAESSMVLDFEGSMIDDLASFFKSFGAEEELYFHLKKHRI